MTLRHVEPCLAELALESVLDERVLHLDARVIGEHQSPTTVADDVARRLTGLYPIDDPVRALKVGKALDLGEEDMAMLSPSEARRVYDRIGRTQDTQAFYEDRATSQLVAHLDLATAGAVFEFGCGTGRFAESLLRDHLRDDAIYRAVDVSPVMVALAAQRLACFGSRASVKLTDGGPPTDEPSGFYDRFVSNFVLDLLSLDDIARVIHEAHRMLRPGGLLGLAGLTPGFTPASRVFGWLWARVHAWRPALVGGCRALDLSQFLPEAEWEVRHHARVAPLGIALEAVVAARRST